MKRQGQKLNLIGESSVIYETQEMSAKFYNDYVKKKESASVSRKSQRTPRNPADALYLQFTEGHLDCIV